MSTVTQEARFNDELHISEVDDEGDIRIDIYNQGDNYEGCFYLSEEQAADLMVKLDLILNGKDDD